MNGRISFASVFALTLGLAACGDTGDATTATGAGGQGTGQGGAANTGGASQTTATSTSTGTLDTTTGAGAGAPDGPSSTRLTPHEAGTTDSDLGFYDYVPPGYPNDGPYPLLVALHGIGENGNGTSELDKVVGVGIGKLLAKDTWDTTRPFVVLVPQHPGGGCPGANEIRDFIAYGMSHYAIDTKRVYLTGLSCGAIGAFSYLGQELDSQIAALVPIAGDGKGAWNQRGCDLGKVAIWAFHGDADGTVNVSGTNVPMDGLATCPSPPRKDAKKTLYPGVGHDSWTRTYDLSAGNDVYTWMLGIQHD